MGGMLGKVVDDARNERSFGAGEEEVEVVRFGMSNEVGEAVGVQVGDVLTFGDAGERREGGE